MINLKEDVKLPNDEILEMIGLKIILIFFDPLVIYKVDIFFNKIEKVDNAVYQDFEEQDEGIKIIVLEDNVKIYFREIEKNEVLVFVNYNHDVCMIDYIHTDLDYY